MKYNLVLLISLLYATSVYSATLPVPVPVTAIRTTDVTDICTTKTSTIRNVTQATKLKVYKLAGIPYGDRTLCTLGYEVDHRVALEDGGSNDISNLQLQAFCTKEQLAPNFPTTVLYDAHRKDSAEGTAHDAICHKLVTPKQAHIELYNWKN